MQPKPPLLELTSARFLAAMAVLLGHFNDFLGLPSWLAGWLTGGFGVSFFFVLSGFILTYRYWDEFAAGVTGGAYRRFFVARIARVYPSYALALLAISAMYLAAHTLRPGAVRFPPDPVAAWLAHLFALQTFAPTLETQRYWNEPGWSISTEFAFYAVCPFILAAIARRSPGRGGLFALLGLAVAAAVAAQAAILVLVFGHGWSQAYWLDVVASRNIAWRLPEFLAGVIAARLLHGGHLPWLGAAGARNALLLAGLAAVSALNLAPWPADPRELLVLRQLRLDVGYMVPFAAIVVALAAGPTFASPVLTRPAWVFLGEASYAIYIYHWIPWTVLTYAAARGGDLSAGLVTGAILLTILFSAASYRWFESPARTFIRRSLGR